MTEDDELEVVWSGRDPLLPPRSTRSTGAWHESKAESTKRPYTKKASARTTLNPDSNIADEKDT